LIFNQLKRYDYEGLTGEEASKIFETLEGKFQKFEEEKGNKADIFKYEDPIDKTISDNQGLRFMYPDGSRFVFRLSGTGSSGATVRLYLEKYSKDILTMETKEALKDIITTALDYAQIEAITGRTKPTVIT
jgi:phosphoglucomutase